MKTKDILRLISINALVVIVSVVCITFTVSAGDVSVSSEPVEIPLDKKGKATLMGSGFEAGQEVRIIILTVDGLNSDITHYCKPAPVADNSGKWSTVWSYERLVKKKLIKEGSYTCIVTDKNYNDIANTKLNFKKIQ